MLRLNSQVLGFLALARGAAEKILLPLPPPRPMFVGADEAIADEASAALRAAGCCLAPKLVPLGLPQAVCDSLSAQLDALLQLDSADDPRARSLC